MQKILSFVCNLCPLCIAKRYWPQSFYAKKVMGRIERGCLFCRAYAKLHPIKNEHS